MKKSLFIAVIWLCVCPSLFSQKKKTQGVPASHSQFEAWNKVYRQGIQYNDLNTATLGLNGMIAEAPEQDALKDTLCMIYLGRGMYDQSRVVATEILALHPDNKEVLEALALSHENLGMLKEAIPNYEKLYQLTQKPYFLYQIGSLQYNLKRLGECEATLKVLIEHPRAKEEAVVISGENNQRQQVSLLAAGYNVLGVVKLDMKEPEAAKGWFEKALELAPNFVLAKNNLNVIKEKPKGN